MAGKYQKWRENTKNGGKLSKSRNGSLAEHFVQSMSHSGTGTVKKKVGTTWVPKTYNKRFLSKVPVTPLSKC